MEEDTSTDDDKDEEGIDYNNDDNDEETEVIGDTIHFSYSSFL